MDYKNLIGDIVRKEYRDIFESGKVRNINGFEKFNIIKLK